MKEDSLFYSGLSGFSDAEGHVGLSGNYHRARAQYTLCNMDWKLLDDFLRGLLWRGYSARTYTARSSGFRQLYVHAADVPRLLLKIQFRHREKIFAKELALAYDGYPWAVAGPIYKSYRRATLVERNVLEAVVARRFRLRADRKRRKKEIFRQRVEATFELFEKGLSAQEVANSLGFSLRTAYRRREKFIRHQNADGRHQ